MLFKKQRKIKGKDMIILELSQKNIEIKQKNKKSVQFTEDVINIINNPGTIVDKYDKIKTLVDDYQSIN